MTKLVFNASDSVALSRVRGLKHLTIGNNRVGQGRTLTSAWIETFTRFFRLNIIAGRTLTSAWIETSSCSVSAVSAPVALSRVRGLKQRPAQYQKGTPWSHSHECVD